MNRLLMGTIAVLSAQLVSSAPHALQKDPPAIADAYHVDASLNFMGQNVCMSIRRPALRDFDYAVVPSPTLRMETVVEGPFEAEAIYTITLGKFGSFSIREGVEQNESCAKLPLNKFVWQNDQDGRRAKAEFCLSEREGTYKVHVQVSMRAQGGSPRQDVKSVLIGMAECHMTHGFSDQARLQLGPYALAYTPQ